MLTALAAGFVAATNAKDSLDILVMGDWGGSPNSPYTTTDEVDSAKIMGEVGSTYDVDMVWGLGDNFYDNGVKNEYDSRFKHTFEDVFDASSLNKIPFYMVAGNHDHYGNVTGEIEYSNHSARWRFPDYWYTHSFKVPGTDFTLQLVMIDTVLLDGISFSHDFCEKYNITDCPIQPRGPADPALAQTQYEWIEATLAASKADFIVVCGHYPVYSIAEHGSTADLIKNLKPLLTKYKVQTYMSGHDHTFEYIDSGDGVDYVDTGGTHVCDSSTSHSNTIPKDSLKFHGCEDGGFTRIRVDKDGMAIYYYYGKSSEVKYTVPTRKSRN